MGASSTSSPSGSGGSIFGRERELAHLDSLVSGLPEHGAALLVRGEAGIGKSALLAAASQRAAAAGMRVLRATGVQSEAELPFAGLHQLLLPLLSGLDKLPSRQREALLAAFGMSEMLDAPDRFLIGLAVLELLSDAAEYAPVLVLADDAQWLDPATAGVLGFVARRVGHEPVGLLLAVRVGEADPFGGAGLPELHLGGLAGGDAEALLAAQERDLAPEVRGRLLDEAAGNPLALVELPMSLSPEELKGTSPLPTPLPLTTQLEQAFTAQAGALPTSAQALLLLAAAADGESTLSEVLEAAKVMGGEPSTAAELEPAISVRLVQLDRTKVMFRHPLVRSAVYQKASLSDRRSAHAALAGVLSEQPDRQAWQRASALAGPDEGVAEALEAAAERARRRGAFGTTIRALERSAQLSEGGGRKGQRLLRAAELAFETGRRELARRLLMEAQRQGLSAAERQRIFFMRVWFGEETPSDVSDFGGIVGAAERVARAGDSVTATNLLLLAASQCYASFADTELANHILQVSDGLGFERDDPKLLFIRALTAPDHYGPEIINTLARIPLGGGGDAEASRLLGTAALVVGDFDSAISMLSAAERVLRTQGRGAVLTEVLPIRAFANRYSERWDLAASDADEGRRLAEENGKPDSKALASAAAAHLAAVRGDEKRAEALAVEIESFALPRRLRAYLIHVQWARGLAALGSGRYDEAYEQLIRLFRPEDPTWHQSTRHMVIGDLSEAARYTGHVDETRALLIETEAAFTRTSWPDAHVTADFARAMLAGDNEAERLFEEALASVSSRRPFVRARLQLAYGTWLRRERRVVDSRAPLRAAREGFDALGATAWAERARQELRASGVGSRPRARNAFEDLTPQELQIARLAASGLSNREIGERLFLSHRTVGVHLYRAFPKLGVTSRGQLRSVLDSTLR